MTISNELKQYLTDGAKEVKKSLSSGKYPVTDVIDSIVIEYFDGKLFESEFGRPPTHEESEEIKRIILAAVSD